jgi:hypothetical protein
MNDETEQAGQRAKQLRLIEHSLEAVKNDPFKVRLAVQKIPDLARPMFETAYESPATTVENIMTMLAKYKKPGMLDDADLAHVQNQLEQFGRKKAA